MKRVLILSYHSLPMDVISSYRTQSYIDFLPKNGFEVILLSMRWELSSDGWKYHGIGEKSIVQKISENSTIIRIPRRKHTKNWWRRMAWKSSFFRKPYILLSYITGNLDINPELKDAEIDFRTFLKAHLNLNTYDAVLSIFSPHFHHKLAYDINKVHGIPYVLDFRDLWKNQVAQIGYAPGLTDRVENYFNRYYWKKWLNKALFFTITSTFWKEFLAHFTDTDGYVIYNGYDSEIANLRGVRPEIFSIVHIGSLYHEQNLRIFLHGFRIFYSTVENKSRVHLYLIGAERKMAHQSNSGIMNPAGLLKEILPKECYTLTPRLPRREALKYLGAAQLLWMPGSPQSPGWINGKFFEFLGSKKFILLTTGSGHEIEQILQSTQSGTVANSSEEVEHVLKALFSKWCRDMTVQHSPGSEYKCFSRSHQIGTFARIAKSYL